MASFHSLNKIILCGSSNGSVCIVHSVEQSSVNSPFERNTERESTVPTSSHDNMRALPKLSGVLVVSNTPESGRWQVEQIVPMVLRDKQH